MNLFIKCEHCDGTGKVRQENFIDKNTRIVENITCDECNGIGYLIKKGHYLSYDLIHTKREINYYWDILKHNIRLPCEYTYDIKKECSKCNGYGYTETQIEDGNKKIFKRTECDLCHGKKYIYTKTIKDVYEEIFQKYLQLKQDKTDIIKALKEKVWKNHLYNSFEEAHPCGYWEVCIRCKTYFDSIENINACCGCTNESMIPENGCYFDPIDEGANEWFKTKGYKKCIGYSPKFKYWKNGIHNEIMI